MSTADGRRDPCYAAVIGAVFFCAAVTAGTVSWDAGGDGTDWHDGMNWSGNAVPTSTDDVCIDLAGTYTVSITAAAEARTLVLGDGVGTQTLDINDASLTVDGPSGCTVGSSDFIVKSGAVLTLRGTSTLTENGGCIIVDPGGQLRTTPTSTSTIHAWVSNQGGNVCFEGDVDITALTAVADTGATNEIQATVTVTLLVNDDTTIINAAQPGVDAVLRVGDGSLNRDGLIQLTSTGQAGSATLEVTDGVMESIDPSGATPFPLIETLAGAGGPRTIRGGFVNSNPPAGLNGALAVIEIGTDTTIDIPTGSTFTNKAIIDFVEDDVTVTVMGSGTFEHGLGGATKIDLGMGGVFDLGTTSCVLGILGAGATIQGADATFRSDGLITFDGRVNAGVTMECHDLVVNGPADLASVDELVVSNSCEQFSRLVGILLTNGPASVWNQRATEIRTQFVDNNGTWRKLGDYLSTTGQFSNDGLIEVVEGTLEFLRGNVPTGNASTGTFDIAENAVLSFAKAPVIGSNGSYILDGANFTGLGEVHLTGSVTVTIENAPASSWQRFRIMEGARLAINSGTTLTIAGIDLEGVELRSEIPLQITEDSTWTKGDLDGAGSVTIEPGVTLTMQGAFGSGGFCDSQRLDVQLLEIAGTVDWLGDCAMRGNGTLHILPGGLWEFNTADPTGLFGTNPTINDGTIRVPAGVFLGRLGNLTNASKSSILEVLGVSLGIVEGPFDQTAGRTTLDNGAALNTFMGCNLTGGRLEGNGTIKDPIDALTVMNTGATVAPGLSAGLLTIDDDYTQTAGGMLEIELLDYGAGIGYDRLVVTGTATLGGTLDVDLTMPFDPPIGTVFDIVTAGTVVGEFDAVDYTGPGTINIIYKPDRVTVQLATFPGLCCTYETPSEFEATAVVNVVATGDLDNDGDQDVVALIPGPDALSDGSFQVFLNNGVTKGTWLGLTATTAVTAGPDPTDLTLALLDDDAFLDVAVTTAGDDSVLVFTSDGVGPDLFTTLPLTITVPEIVAPSSIAAGDFDGDGPVDLAVASSGTDDVVILRNTTPPSAFVGGATFVVDQVIAVGANPISVDPRDLDDDKDIDLVAANANDDTVSILENGLTGFAAAFSVATAEGPFETALADLDGNGFADIVTTSSAGRVAIILNQGGLVFEPFFEIEVGTAPVSVDAADLDADGDVDLAVVAIDDVLGASVIVIDNLSEGGTGLEFSDPEAFDVLADPNFVVIADMDGNPFPDFVSGNTDTGPTGGSVTVLLASLMCPSDQNGDGVIGFPDLTSLLSDWGTCPTPPQPCPLDTDGDGNIGFTDLTGLLNAWGDCP